MSNHLHLIISRSDDGEALSGKVRDFKKYTSSKIISAIEENNQESRRNWMLWMLWIFKSAGMKNKNNKYYQFWKQDSHAEQLLSNDFMTQKLDYIHNNPVEAGIVDEPVHYKYSSARDYAGINGLLSLQFVE
jgi:REP element-mobilizing transposase RayT